jgi:dihydroxy-acid dehydratase
METMYEGYCCDAMITLGGCDKSVPASVMPLARCNAIGLSFYGGSNLPGKCDSDKNLDPGQVMEAIGKYGSGLIDIEELHKIECTALPVSGACCGMFTSCTMASILQTLGMLAPYSTSAPTTDYNNNLNP